METEKKKHKSGYELLKEKVAKLEAQNAGLQNDLQVANECKDRYWRFVKEDDEKIAFLLDHCPFWTRWMYRRKFEKRKE